MLGQAYVATFLFCHVLQEVAILEDWKKPLGGAWPTLLPSVIWRMLGLDVQHPLPACFWFGLYVMASTLTLMGSSVLGAAPGLGETCSRPSPDPTVGGTGASSWLLFLRPVSQGRAWGAWLPEGAAFLAKCLSVGREPTATVQSRPWPVLIKCCLCSI